MVKPPQFLLLMFMDVAQMWKRWARSVNAFETEVGCVCSEQDKLKGKGEVMHGEVFGRVSGVGGVSARKGVSLLLSRWLLRCVVEWKVLFGLCVLE